MLKSVLVIATALILACPASAQSVRAGIAAWQRGEHGAAVGIWTPLAAKGDADAAFNLGQAYRLGKGVTIDLARSQQYLAQAAGKGHVDAAATLGILLFQNNDRKGAMRWLKLAADGGETRSMLLYGVALYNGDGIAPDPVTAYAYVSRSAAQGLDLAKDTLADMDAAMPLDQRKKGLALAKSMVGGKVAAAKPAARPKATKPATMAKAAPASVAPPPPSGKWRIQLGAFGQRASAEALFAKVRGKVGGRQAFYVPAGKVVRLQVGPYESSAAAEAGCSALRGQACFPVAAR